VSLLILLFQIFNFREGDILFQDCDCGAICDAIEEVTISKDKRRYSHIGFVVMDQNQLKVIEANTQGVKMVNLDSFINRYHNSKGRPTISVGRLRPGYRSLIASASGFCKSKLGIAYDTVFLLNNNVYYCSELIYDAFKSANNNREFFKLYPMTFKKRGLNQSHPEFKKYYESIGCTIPEGELGLNPGSISRDSRIQIHHLY
jgi:hypothetical protein